MLIMCMLCLKQYQVLIFLKLLNLVFVKDNDVFVIGDSSNDIEMIKKYYGVGMKNSCDEILCNVKKTYNEVSDYIDNILKKV